MHRLITLLLLFIFSHPGVTFAQTFSGAGADIPDDGPSITFDIPVSGLPTPLDTLNFGLERICINITHTWIADLALSLRAPDGTIIPLLSGVGGDQDGFVNTCLSGNAGTSVYEGAYPYTGEFRPFGDMGAVNNGQSANGVWQLVILDTYPFADAGALLDWSITFGPQPCKPFPFGSSDLPILKINTGGVPIPNEPKLSAQLTVIDNGPGQRNYPNQPDAIFTGSIGVELHGNSTQSFPKKNLRIETRDSLGEDLNVSLLGLPPTSDYVLYANFSDKTLMRNALAYDLSRRLGLYAPRTRFCELVVDNTYQGVYLLAEKIKRGKNRVDIAKLTPADTVGTALTGGYILKIDWNSSAGWNSPFSQPNSPNIFTYFQHEYPKVDSLQPVQREYIRAYVDSFEVALTGADFQDSAVGWRRFAQEKTFLDFLMVNEISKNVDGYRLSTYFNKDRDDRGGKLRMGPVWDFDLAFYNADYCDNFKPEGWAYDINYVCMDAGVPFWWERLQSDTLFSQNLACYWQHLREGRLHTDSIFHLVDSMAAVVNEAQARNFLYWPILGHYVWPNPGPLPNTYTGEVQKMKDWLTDRLTWLDFAIGANLPDLNATYQANSLSALSWQFQAASGRPDLIYAWDFDDSSYSTLPNPTHEFAAPGTYHVRLTVATPYGCTAVTEQILHIVNTAAHQAAGGTPAIFPNPAQDEVQLVLPEGWQGGKARVQLLDALGHQVLEQALPLNGKLRLLEIPAGVYEVMVSVEGQTWRGRLFKA